MTFQSEKKKHEVHKNQQNYAVYMENVLNCVKIQFEIVFNWLSIFTVYKLDAALIK